MSLMTMNKTSITIAVVVVLFMLGSLGVYYASIPDWVPLYSEMTQEQKSRIAGYLSESNIRFEDSGDTLLVTDANRDVIRFELIEKGILQNPRTGLEIFTDIDYGMTEFAQSVNYQRALQGEIEKTLIAIRGINDARVHIQSAQKSRLFEQVEARTASAILTLEPGYQLPIERVKAIQKFVSSVVAGLSLQNVTILDQYGNLLIDKPDEVQGMEQSVNHKEELESAVRNILAPFFSAGEVSVSVSVNYSNERVKKRTESLLNTENAPQVRKKQRQKPGPDGVMVALDSESEYLYGRVYEDVEQLPGRVISISAAVAINHRGELGLEIEQIEALVSSALGLQAERGDRVSVVVRAKTAEEIPVAIVEQAPPIEQSPAKVVAEIPGIDNPSQENSMLWGLLVLAMMAAAAVAATVRHVKLRQRQQQVLIEQRIDQWLKTQAM